ncbi:para-nitrobenzyl esterase [Algoriphagus alkaliphilus]|uniref:Carboxylic ester hydrolase n=1 Tax=Algoriphagus alkaliphilus TaxID=279824 RepID=A0A1G5UZW6_9BACT|nr:carboxylesterase family protein [Algoriphagus alkaliphilus]MBA4300673.1 carboxylesterase/lipase family protein [Cyclobacterium sp.]SDA39160.1 para-nitrobenzyl esterase [Algoriphagus alkaliphilus]
MKNNRRDFLQKIGLGTAGLTAVPFIANASPLPTQKTEVEDEQFLQMGDDIAIAQTSYGKIQGYILNGIYTYLGVPYGADTAGKNRFMPPQKPAPWKDIKPTLWWGNTAPQNMDRRYANPHASFADHWNYDDVSEDCLKLNVWTPALADGKKRPVMVWLHGGGFTNGNAIEQDGYHGENFSRKGDVVFVSINHRLGPIGFTDLSGVGGAKYASSGNVSQLDIIASLEWVRDNIANFGGDPGNVTIMGQSGGGAKVTCTMAMPASKGLVHKGVALSGSMLKANDQDYSRKLGQFVLEAAGLQPNEVDKLQEIPWREYIDIGGKAMDRMRKENPLPGFRGGFGPVADGVNVPQGEFFSNPNDHTADIPLMICTTFHEWGATRTNPKLESAGEAEIIEAMKQRFGDKSPEVYQAYATNFPGKKPAEIMTLAASNRANAVACGVAKAKQKGPVYMAWFGWEPNLYNGRMRAFHCIDICFWFDNTDRMYTHTGGGKRPRALSEKMSASLLSFMRTGNPTTGALPDWPKFTAQNGETMVLNDVSEVKNDPDRNARKVLA